MRALCTASLTALLFACGSAPEVESETDEGALATTTASTHVVVADSIETPVGQIPSWTTDVQGRLWTFNRERAALALVGQRPTIQVPEPARDLSDVSFSVGRATMVVSSGPLTALQTSIMQVDLASGTATTILPDIMGGDTLAVDRAGVAYTVGFVHERSGLNDLVKVEPNGTVTKLAPDILAPRPDKSCAVSLLVDDASVFGIQGCVGGPSEIVQVPKTGGSAKIVAGATGEITGVTHSETDIVYSLGGAIMRLPKSGGAPQLVVKRTGTDPGSALAVRNNEVWYTEHLAAADGKAPSSGALWLSKAPLGGGPATRVALLPALPQSTLVSTEAILSAKDGVHVALLDSAGQKPWQHRLLRVVGTEK